MMTMSDHDDDDDHRATTSQLYFYRDRRRNAHTHTGCRVSNIPPRKPRTVGPRCLQKKYKNKNA